MKHRILLRGNKFYPQYKGWFFWHNFYSNDPLSGAEMSYLKIFDTIKEAVDFIEDERYEKEKPLVVMRWGHYDA